MDRILIWGVGNHYNQYINAIKYYEILGEIKVIGITGKDKLYACLDGYPFIPLEHIEAHNIDYIAVTSEGNFDEISKKAMSLGFSREVLILAKVFCLPGFRFEKYKELLHAKVSIIANNCWGGLMYHALGMKFRSPFINMREDDENYLKLLSNLQYYLGLDLKFERFNYNPGLQIEYPICKLDDVELHFNHYTSMGEVESKWYERVRYINWDNLFIMMVTKSQESLKVFESLSYPKKICFVPFESSLESAFHIHFAEYEEVQSVAFGQIVNGIPRGNYHDYDIIKLLLTGKPNHDRYYIR